MAASKAWTAKFAALLVQELGRARAAALVREAQAIDAPQNASLRATLTNLRDLIEDGP